MIKGKYFKVRFGFGVNDFVSVKDEEVEKAIYAQVKGTPTRLGNSFVNGRNIVSITPHYHKYTGWFDSYEPQDGEDWKQIERDCPKFDGVLESYTNRVRELMSKGEDRKIGTLGVIELPFEVKTQIHNTVLSIVGEMPNKKI